ncbi:MAG: universal stress protein [Actinomycetota bacterium]|nr:universal stress protein [Actinomycetota bacterium]
MTGQGRIVVGVDGSESADRALAFALGEGRLRDWEVDVVHAWLFPAVGYSPYLPTPNFSESDMEAAGAEILDRALAVADTAGARITRRLVMGGSAPVLLEAAAAADLLVVGTRGHGGFAALLLGSTSQHCAHHPPCPVVIVP